MAGLAAGQSSAGLPAVRPLVTQPVNEAQLSPLAGNVHPLARAEFDQGLAPADLPMERMLLVLKRSPEQEQALIGLLDQQQDKNSSSYHQWLTPEQFGSQFGLADSDLQAITGWLQSHGFQVSEVSKGRTVIEFSGTAALVQQAFHTTIHKYLVNGESHWANASDPEIPSALAPAIGGIASLHNFFKQPMNRFAGTYSKSLATGKVTPINPQFTFPEQYCSSVDECFALGPYDFATIYNLLPLWSANVNGAGQTIAIVARTNIDAQDAHNFRSLFNLPANDPTVILNGPDPGIGPDEGEADIDVQWSGAAAPGATIDLVVSESTEITDGIDLSALYIVDNNLAGVMSESYGSCEFFLGTAYNQFYSAVWEQAAAQGITAFVSSGDNGSAGCDFYEGTYPQPAKRGLAVNGIASTPFNVAIGGTDFNDFSNPLTYWNTSNDPTTQASAKGYVPETTWNDTCTNSVLGSIGYSTNPETNCNNGQIIQDGLVYTVAGSGGASSCTSSGQTLSSCSGGYAKPSWQTGTGVPADGKRDLPDVSLFASNGFMGSFYIVCQGDTNPFHTCDLNTYLDFAGYGGTSVASPAFAGIMAMVDQKMGARQGNANYILYKLAAKPSASCASKGNPAAGCTFYDVTAGTIAPPCTKGSPNCTTAVSSHQYGVLSGYSAAAGYDLATGLGSVNAANLVNNWNTVTFTPSATALTLNSGNPVNIAHGTAVNVGISVTPQSGTGTPTGDVSLITSNGKSVGGYTLTNGAVADTTSLLPGGTYTVSAHYGGSATYGGSDSTPPVSVTVTSESSKTFADLVTLANNGAITSFNASSATYGSGYFLLRVDVGDAAASISTSTGISSKCAVGTASCPTGTIALTSSGAPLAESSLLLNGEGYAEDQSIAPGSYTVSASYPGDASYGASTGGTSFTIAKAPTTVTAAVPGSPVQYGNLMQIDAEADTTSNGIAPTGTFVFVVDGSAVTAAVPVYESGGYNPGSSPPYAWADAISTTAFPSVGMHTLSAQYSGDAYYAAATGAPVSVTVTKAQPSFLGWGAIPSPADWQQQVTLTARLYGSDKGDVPTGTMAFLVDSTAVTGTVVYTQQPATALTGSILIASLPYTPSAPGAHTMAVNYSGDGNYLSATAPNFTFTVNGPFSVTPAASVTIASPGQSGSTNLTVSPNGAFSGTVTLSCTPDPNAKESSCSFASGTSSTPTLQVTLNGSSATATLNVTTTAPHTTAALRFPVASGSVLAAFVFLCVPIGRRRRALFAVAALALTLSLGACGGGGSSGGGGGGGGHTDPGTAVGNYAFTVTAVAGSGSSAITVSSQVTVSVQ